MRKIEKDILNGNIAVQLMLFFFPIFFGTLFQQLYNTVDAIVVGNYVGKAALAAVGGSTGTLINLLVNFAVGLSSGATVIIAQCYGRKAEQEVSIAVKSAITLAVLMGGIMMILGIFFSRTMLEMMSVPEEVMVYSLAYMRIYFVGVIPMMIYNVGAGILRATGDSKRPLYFLMASCITNVLLDIVFVVIFKLGVVGVASATALSQTVSCLLTLYVFDRTNDLYHYNLKEFGYDKDVLASIVRIGLPMGFQSVLYSVSNLFIQRSVNGFGTDTIAAYTAYGKVDALYWNVDGAFGNAVLTIVGQNFGAKKMDRVKKTVYVSSSIFALFTLIIVIPFEIYGRELLGLFTDDLNVIAIGYEMLSFIAIFWFLFIPIEILSSTIRACGNSIVPMLMAGVGICGVRILWIMFYPYTTVIEALYSYPISWGIASLMYMSYYFSGLWLKGVKTE